MTFYSVTFNAGRTGPTLRAKPESLLYYLRQDWAIEAGHETTLRVFPALARLTLTLAPSTARLAHITTAMIDFGAGLVVFSTWGRPERNKSVVHLPSAPHQDRLAAESASEKDLGLRKPADGLNAVLQ